MRGSTPLVCMKVAGPWVDGWLVVVVVGGSHWQRP